MALNPENLQFLFQNLQNADFNNYAAVTKQLFNYLKSEIKDNPVYEKYESEKGKWLEWVNTENLYYLGWSLPENLEDTKNLAFCIYSEIAAKNKDWADNFALELFSESRLDENVYKVNETFLGYFGKALSDIVNANPEKDISSPTSVNGDIVFIIHGHDNELKKELQLLLITAGVNCIVLHEQPDKGRTIIDKLVEETNIAGYAIALLTPDDLMIEGVVRARQNVILEIGYFLGKLGKERIRMIVKGDVEIPSDLQGILYEKHDDSGAWKIKLLKEMQAVGIFVDLGAVVSKF